MRRTASSLVAISTQCGCARTRRPTSLAPSCSTRSRRSRQDGRRPSAEPSRRSTGRGRRGTRRYTWATRGARAPGCSSPMAPASRRRSSGARQPTTAPSIPCSASAPTASRVRCTFRRESVSRGRSPPNPGGGGGRCRGASCAAAGAPGLGPAETQLECIGSAVPTPAWAQYAQDPATIPSRCVDTASAVTISPRPNATVFDPGYAAPRAWRASLGLQQQLPGAYTVTVDASYSRGVQQYGFRDLNLVATPQFTLPDEGGRPVYVPADSIVPTTGALTSLDSRAHPQFGQVIAIGSDLQSDSRQLAVGVSRLPPRGAALQLSYTFTRARDQSSFSCCAVSQGFAAPTTAGDPNGREWATSAFERRHSLLATVTYPVNAALEVTALGRLTSGIPFTPLVGSDVNGDGARNDRAFVFDPATASDSSVAAGMRALLATAPSAVRDCLGRQLGHVAGRNSCTGPWQPALDFQINWRPASFGRARRLTVSLLTVNLLGGLDQWLHGAANLHGWGFAAAPDPVLLYVRSFDPVARRFSYGVNGRFGATAGPNGGVAGTVH